MAQFSVWALAPPTHPRLLSTTQHLRSIFGGPEFEAHVTVLGGVTLPLDEAVARLRKLAQSLAPIKYRIRAVSSGATYFQSVFLTVDPTPKVLEANGMAKELFETAQSENTAYFPHLSLLYGFLNDEDKRTAQDLAEKLGGDILIGSEFVVSSLSLWATDTDDQLLTTWEKVAEFPLETSS